MLNIPERFRDLKRFRQIVDVGIKYGFSYFFKKAKLTSKKPKKKKIETNPVKFRKAFEELGGTFIKLAQLLSLRPDLIPNVYCEEFSKLQDTVPPFSDKQAKETLKKELKYSAHTVHLRRLIASASIGQVYEAEIMGERVAIKIMRPEIEKLIRTDLDLLYFFSKVIKRHIHSKVIDPMQIYEQFKIYTENELDYLKEAKNIDTFHRNFLNTDIKIPHVYWNFTTKRVLTMEYIDGKELFKKRLSRKEKKKIAQKIANSIYKQIFLDGIFHGDPHPGNIMLTKNNEVAFIDFGIVGKINEALRKNLSNLFISLISKDIEGMVDALVDLSLVSPDVNRSEFKQDIVTTLGKYYNIKIKSINTSELILNTFKTAKRNNVSLPKDFILLGKVYITLDGVGKKLCPDFNMIKESEPFLRHLLRIRFSPKRIYKRLKSASPQLIEFLLDVPKKTNAVITEIHDLDNKFSKLESDLNRIQKNIALTTNRLIMGIVIGALLISFSLVLSINQPLAFIMLGITLFLLIDLFYGFAKEKRG